MRRNGIFVMSLLAVGCVSAPGERAPTDNTTAAIAESKTNCDAMQVLEPTSQRCFPDLVYAPDTMERFQTSAEFRVRGMRKTRGYDGPAKIRQINGVEFEALAKADGKSLDWLNEIGPIAGNPTAMMLYVELSDSPLVPAGIVFVPMPESGVELPEKWVGQATTLQLGVSTLPRERNPKYPRFEPGSAESQTEVVSVARQVTEDELRDKIDQTDGRFVAVLSADGVACMTLFRPVFASLDPSVVKAADVVEMSVGDPVSHAFAQKLVRSERGVAIPSVLVFEGGEVIDFQYGPGSYWLLRDLLARNGFEDTAYDWVFDYTKLAAPESEEQRMRWMRSMTTWNSLASGRFDGADLSGGFLKRRSFANSSLRNVDFSGADLTGSNFAYADLTGATLAGAVLDDVIWTDTTCPDGQLADAHGGTCEGVTR